MPNVLDISEYVVSQGVVALPCNLSDCGLLGEILVLKQQHQQGEGRKGKLRT